MVHEKENPETLHLPGWLQLQTSGCIKVNSMPTGIVQTEMSRLHTYPGHPEHAGRLDAVLTLLDQQSWARSLVRLASGPVDDEDSLRAHSPYHLENLRETAYGSGLRWIDADTYTNEYSWEAARNAAGAVVALTRGVLAGEIGNGFALVRPPGHHATPDRAMGFCLLNNIAVAATWALTQAAIERVMILDFDVHHGNGTQDVFWNSDSVLVVSLHQSPLYPFTGAVAETGGPQAEGFNCNLPLPSGVGDQGYLKLLDDVVSPLAERFGPDLILVSAGYDGHWQDPLSNMHLSVAGYIAMVRRIVEMASHLCQGRLVFTLEGGYQLDVLANAVVNSIAVLAETDGVGDPFGTAPGRERPIADLISQLHSQWFGEGR